VSSIQCSWGAAEQALKLLPSLPFWFNPVWMNALAELHQITPRVLITHYNDNPVAFLPVYEKKLLTLRKAYNPVLAYYSPVLYITDDRKVPNRTLLLEYELAREMGAALKTSYRKILINLNPETYDIRGFRDAGLKATPQYTFIKDLETGFQVHKNEMTTLRKAEKQGFTFDADRCPERLLELVYGMYSRKSHPFRINRAKLGKLIKTMFDNNLVEQYNVRQGKDIVSSILILQDGGEVCYAWLTGSEPSAMQQGVNIYLFRELFNSLGKRFHHLDLCGANSQGPSRLKAALGAELKLFFQLSL
jgi:hypothetical protein